ncbi:MAG: substrate-binding periplasmic protein [Candidatus Heimdallarchaeota archaeon]
MRREFAVIGIIAGIVGGFFAGWLIPALVTNVVGGNLVQRIQNRPDGGYIIIGTSADYPPFEDVYTNGTYYGFDIDLCELIAAELGVSIQWRDMDFDSLIGACRGGTIDMIAAAMTYTVERAQKLAASLPYINVSQVVIVNETTSLSITELADLSVLGTDELGVQAGTTLYDELIAAGLSDEVQEFARADLLMIDLAVTGGIQAAYVDEPVYTAWSGVYNLDVIWTSGEPEQFSLWCRHRSADLLFIINQVIHNAFQDGTMNVLYNKWFGNVTV